jgi:hypothetical protein
MIAMFVNEFQYAENYITCCLLLVFLCIGINDKRCEYYFSVIPMKMIKHEV